MAARTDADIVRLGRGPEQFMSVPPEMRAKLRAAVYAQPELFDQFVQENPSQLSAGELAIVARWKHAVIGDF